MRTGEGQEDIPEGRCEQQCGRGTNLVHCGSDQSWELLCGRMGREVEHGREARRSQSRGTLDSQPYRGRP